MKINRDEFISMVKESAGSDMNVDNIKLDDRLADIGIDSLGFATLLWAIEEKFEIQVDDKYLEGLNGLSSVSDLIALFKVLGYEINVEHTA